MLRSLMTISGFTLMSRVLGLLRDQIMAIFVGACAASDAYLAAFRFPNMGRLVGSSIGNLEYCDYCGHALVHGLFCPGLSGWF